MYLKAFVIKKRAYDGNKLSKALRYSQTLNAERKGKGNAKCREYFSMGPCPICSNKTRTEVYEDP